MLSNTGVNKVILLGQVTGAPAFNTDRDNTRYLCFTLVTKEMIKRGADGYIHEEHHNICVLEKLVTADLAALKPGQTIYIEGRLQTTALVDSNNIRRYNLVVIATKADIMPATA